MKKENIARKFCNEFESYVWNGDKDEPFGKITLEDGLYRDICEDIDTFLDGFNNEYGGCDCSIDYDRNYHSASISFKDGSKLILNFVVKEHFLCLDSFAEFGNQVTYFENISNRNIKIFNNQSFIVDYPEASLEIVKFISDNKDKLDSVYGKQFVKYNSSEQNKNAKKFNEFIQNTFEKYSKVSNKESNESFTEHKRFDDYFSFNASLMVNSMCRDSKNHEIDIDKIDDLEDLEI